MDVTPISAPVFVACAPRSGSTLLRFLLDAHPDLVCPGETDLAVLAAEYVRTAGTLGGAFSTAETEAGARHVVEGMAARLLERAGKSRWCDKSLSNVAHLDLLARLWPEARFVLLVRHCMDFIDSGLRSSPFGFENFGFTQIAASGTTNAVGGLAALWADRASRLLAFEQAHPDRCVRVRYEDLVADPAGEMARLFSALDLTATPVAFSGEHDTSAPADYSIWYTEDIHQDSVDTGARIPARLLTGALRSEVNALLTTLGYRPVDDRWGSGDDVEDVALPAHLVDVRVVAGHRVLERHVVDLTAYGEPRMPGAPTAPRAPLVVALEQDALAAVLAGKANAGQALREGRIRCYGAVPATYGDERTVISATLRFLARRG